ncbi:hypothetical protein [Phormidium tenue]|uniref:Uncharacterized protein n=1 Tax=Phormidium tenue NIES-30 TaxID=549789 RepID=A0A1U7J6F5_9CYAN|nr:hypothetical protein [Phormidium tenue]MBD2231962.1 hypothetical protein [Phormidium tenue FACHB-1052]OKH48440.1 hypothetical protein NIES30_10490 [Phormidium tenue NIES-30]
MFYRDRPLVRQAVLAAGTVLLLALGGDLQAQEPPEPEPNYLRPAEPCPSDPQVLATQLLADLPSYANRVSSRNLDLSTNPIQPVTTILVASAPDFTPLELSQMSPAGAASDREPDAGLQQVFFTTLERQYWQGQPTSLQHHHWLFLTPTQDGWHMALLFSSLGTYPSSGPLGSGSRPPTPPQESSDGIVGQAVRLWLRDCRAEAVFPPDAEVEISPGPSTNP